LVVLAPKTNVLFFVVFESACGWAFIDRKCVSQKEDDDSNCDSLSVAFGSRESRCRAYRGLVRETGQSGGIEPRDCSDRPDANSSPPSRLFRDIDKLM
jgi:hypothetical protein